MNEIFKKYKKLKIDKYLDEFKKIKQLTSRKNKNKKHKCEKCGKVLSSNYKKHIESNICKKNTTDEYDYKCYSCDTVFASKQNLKYHQMNNVCGHINKIDNQINNSNINSNNTTNNTANTQNNIQINVNSERTEMLPFRDASYKITTKKYLEYANNPRRVNLYFLQKYKCPDQAIKQFVKDYHLNPNKPERQNILNTNRRDNRVQLFDFDEDFICRWQTKDKSKVLELLCDRGVNALFFAKTMLAAAGIKLDPKKEIELNAKIKEYESSDKVKKKYVDMIGDLTYDYRDMVESNKKKVDSQVKQLEN